MRRTVALPFVLVLGWSASAAADPEDRRPWDCLRERWSQVRAEAAIESAMVRAELRGRLGPQPPAPDWTPRRHGKGRLELGPGGVPILHLEGTPEEMGAQHGALVRRELQALQRYVEAFVGRRELPRAKRRAEERFAAHWPDDLRREATALAEASGVPLDDVLFAQAFTDLYRAFACSTLSAPSPEGPFLARNLDFPGMGFLQRYSIVVVARPAGKRAFVGVGWPGLVGVLSGQSLGADAVALSVLVVHDDSGAQPGVPYQLAFRVALESARSAGDVEALLRELPKTCTNNLMVVDAAGDARVLELHPDGVVTRRPQGRRLVATNHFVSPERRERRASFSYASSRVRFDRVQRTCPPGAGAVPLERAREALRAASVSATVQSMIFLPARGEVEVAFTRRAASAAKTGRFVRLGPRELEPPR
jgi:predicted choloylglycine hydrolase